MNGIFEMLEALLHVTGNSIEMAVTGPEVSFPFSCGKATLANFNGKGTLGWNIKVNTVLTGSPEDQAQGKDQNPRRPTGSTEASPPQDLLGYEPPLLTQWCQGAYKGCREGNGNPLQYSCLENPMDGEAWQKVKAAGSETACGFENGHSVCLFSLAGALRRQSIFSEGWAPVVTDAEETDFSYVRNRTLSSKFCIFELQAARTKWFRNALCSNSANPENGPTTNNGCNNGNTPNGTNNRRVIV
ncbi:hypothetical protein MG293_001501 [Ovis ammon polii]|uniref:Uncharacterized protein n=1 Tax=Ovis ammon polii TaxID=230172 RepID=A0AAD4UN61_OVIAM|nr:hypothetical protein MG293_001501 [Ovis ammon polii]